MQKRYAKKDIYNQNGVLLIAKGQIVTNEHQARLGRLGSDINNTHSPENETDFSKLTKLHSAETKERLHISNTEFIESSSAILDKIIFESKDAPWWPLVNTLANHIDWLYSHSLDVSLISLMISLKLGLDEKLLHDIALGALLHDIGKLMVPKEIIQKPSKLTEQEFQCIKQHCELGFSMVTGYHFNKPILEIILLHHERMDGTGYPYALKASDIPLHAQIVMVADCVDAITAYRPYKPAAKSIDFAIKELKKSSSQYPEEIVSIFETL